MPEDCCFFSEVNEKKNLCFPRHFLFLYTSMAPVQRPENIATLINGVERYNPENIDVLVAYLDKQCETGEYDLEANLAILKLYEFYITFKPPIVN